MQGGVSLHRGGGSNHSRNCYVAKAYWDFNKIFLHVFPWRCYVVKQFKMCLLDTVDNFFVTMEGGKSLKLMEVAEVKQSDKEFHITPMLDSKNVRLTSTIECDL